MGKRMGLWTAVIAAMLLVASGAAWAEEVVRPEYENLNLPAAWKDVTAQQRLLAVRAAELDAARLLAERIYGVQLDSNTQVMDLAFVSDEICGVVDELIKGVRTKEIKYVNDLSVEAVREVTIRKVIETIERTITREGTRFRVKHDELENIKTRTEDTVLAVMGNGAVPGSLGHRRIMAKRAAQMDLDRRLAERILGMRLSGETTVRDLVLENDRILTCVAGTLTGVKYTRIVYRDDDSCEVTGNLILRQVVERIEQTIKRYSEGRVKEEEWTKIKTENRDTVLTETGTGAPSEAQPAPEFAGMPPDVKQPFLRQRTVIQRVIRTEVGAVE